MCIKSKIKILVKIKIWAKRNGGWAGQKREWVLELAQWSIEQKFKVGNGSWSWSRSRKKTTQQLSGEHGIRPKAVRFSIQSQPRYCVTMFWLRLLDEIGYWNLPTLIDITYFLCVRWWVWSIISISFLLCVVDVLLMKFYCSANVRR